MATQKPRITITITPRQHEVLKAVSAFSGQPMSAFISELLEVSMPTVERMAATFQKLKKAQTIEREKYLHSLEQTQSVMEGLAQQATGQFDLFMTAMEKSVVGGVETHGAAGGHDDIDNAPAAPVTNRGATDPLAGRSKPKRSKAAKPIPKPAVLKKTAAINGHKKGAAA